MKNPMKIRSISRISAPALVAFGLVFFALPGMAENDKSSLNSADERFVKREAAAGLEMVKIAGIGVKKSERADIKAFAETIVADHTQANVELTKLAASKGVTLESGQDLKPSKNEMALNKESGVEFDKAFLALIVSGHGECVSNFELAARDSNDHDLKAWAGKMVPALKAHLVRAEELNSMSATSAAR